MEERFSMEEMNYAKLNWEPEKNTVTITYDDGNDNFEVSFKMPTDVMEELMRNERKASLLVSTLFYLFTLGFIIRGSGDNDHLVNYMSFLNEAFQTNVLMFLNVIQPNNTVSAEYQDNNATMHLN